MKRRIIKMQRSRRAGQAVVHDADENMARLYQFSFPELDLLRQHYRPPEPPSEFEDRLLARLVTDHSTEIVRRAAVPQTPDADDGSGEEWPPLDAPRTHGSEAPLGSDELLAFVEGRRLLQRRAGTRTVAYGTVLARRYRIARLLSRAGSGELYEALDLERGKRVAVKLLGAEVGGRQEVMIELRRLVERVSQVSHASVCRMHECDAASGISHEPWPFLTMELVRGHSLRAYLDAMGPLPMSKGLVLARQLLQALSVAHGRGITHGDLGSESVWLWCPRVRGSFLPFRAVIMDFGLARTLNEARGHGLDGVGLLSDGGPQAGASDAVQADLSAFGELMFEVLTGRARREHLPQPNAASEQAPLPSGMRRGVPRELEELLLRCLGREPKRCYGSAGAALMDLERCANAADEGSTTPLERASWPSGALSWLRRKGVLPVSRRGGFT